MRGTMMERNESNDVIDALSCKAAKARLLLAKKEPSFEIPGDLFYPIHPIPFRCYIAARLKSLGTHFIQSI